MPRMKMLAAIGLVVLSGGVAGAAYDVELTGGDRMRVESYWEEGGRIHLVKGGVDLIYPKSRVVSVREVDAAVDVPVTRRHSATADGPAARVTTDATTREDLEASKERIEKHLLRVQAERFEAKARGDDSKAQRRLDREFRRTQVRRSEVERALDEAQD